MCLKFKELHNNITVLLEKINTKNYIKRQRHYQTKVKISLICTLIIWFFCLGLNNFKHYYERFIKFYYQGRIISYTRFMYWKKELYGLLEELFSLIISKNKKSEYYIVDSSALPVCKSHKIASHKTFIRTATLAHTSTGKFFGFKIHLLINQFKQIEKFIITTGKEHDINSIINHNIIGKLENTTLLLDSGYVSKDLKSKLKKEKNINYLAKPKRNMEKQFNEEELKIYKHRFKVETVFHLLKDYFCLSYQKSKSLLSLKVNILCTLIAYQLFYFLRQD